MNEILGHRAKMGVIIPTVNTVTEPEFNAMKPPGVTVHFTRMPIHFHPEEDDYKELMDDLQIRLDEFSLFGANIVAYNCTVGSMACPPDMLINKLEESTGATGVATAGSVVLALKTLGAAKISMATPYPDTVNEHEKEFLAGHGIEVLNMAGMEFGMSEPERGRMFARVPPDEAFEHALSVDDPDARALFLSCANFHTAGIVQRLEDKLGKPVVTSNICTFWAALRKAGITDPIEGYGTLLREH